VTDPGAPTQRFRRIEMQPKTFGRPEPVGPPPDRTVEQLPLFKLARAFGLFSVLLFFLCFSGLCVLGTAKLVMLMGFPW